MDNLTNTEIFLKPPVDEDIDNYIPEEILSNIFSYVPLDCLLKLSLVCKSWCKLIRSTHFWFRLYKRTYKKAPKRYPWYVFYAVFTGRLDDNLLTNGIVQLGPKYWILERNEDGSLSLETDFTADINRSDCLTCWTGTPFCTKKRLIHFSSNKLLTYILQKHQPHIYLKASCVGSLQTWLFAHNEILAQKTNCNNKGLAILRLGTRELNPVEVIYEHYNSEIVTSVGFWYVAKSDGECRGDKEGMGCDSVVKVLLDSIIV